MNDGEFTPQGDVIPTKENWDSQEGMQARVNLCQKKIRDALKEFDCGFKVPTLHIGTGRIIPEIQIVPAAPQPKSSPIVDPNVDPAFKKFRTKLTNDRR
jgi:hypothetical protein